MQAVCRDLPHWAYARPIAGGAAAVAAVGEAGPGLAAAVEAMRAAIKEAVGAALEREDAALAWAAARAARTMGLLGPALPHNEGEEGGDAEAAWQAWEDEARGR